MSDEASLTGRPADAEVVVLPAEIDVSNADMVLAALSAVLRRGVRIVIADLRATVFCDCSGVAALLSARRQSARLGAELRVVAQAGQVRRLFDLTGLDQLIAV